MASKFVALFALVAVASAQHYQNDYYQHQHEQPQYHQYHQAPAVIKSVQPALIKSYQPAVVKQIVQPTLIKKIVEHEEPANYEFNYDVHDPHTGDIKQQHEHAHDGAISGQYSLIDADGYRRTVEYTADDHHGFVANVRREPVEGHKIIKTVQPALHVQKVIAQPAVHVQKVIAQPQYYSAPAHHEQHYSAPAVHVQKYVQPAVHVQKYVQPAQQYYSAPAHHDQHYYSAPAPVKIAVAQPVVHKYVAPVVEKYAAPAPQYYSAPVVKAVAHQPIKYSTAEHASHVSFQGPASHYHY